MRQLEVRLHHTQIKKISNLVKYEEPRVIRRCNILSCLHQGMATSQIAAVLHIDRKTVRNTATHFLESGLEPALYDDKRSGRPIDIDDRERSRIVAMVCSDPPAGNYRWTLELLAREAARRGVAGGSPLSRETIRVILKEHDLKPWQEKMWCIGEVDDEYIERMEDILEVYERPHDPKRPVICVDEKPVALLDDVRDPLPIERGKPTRVDCEYERGGSANVFTAVEPKAGVYMTKVTESRDAI